MSEGVHGGNLRQVALEAGAHVDELVDFSANINPLGPPEWLRQVIGAHVGALVHYPDPDCSALVEAAAARFSVAEGEVVVGNGSAEIVSFLPRVLGAQRALIVAPAYADYRRACEAAGLAVSVWPLEESCGWVPSIEKLETALAGGEIVWLGQPNNPTGVVCNPSELRDLARRWPTTTFVIDEAFADFVDGLDTLTRDRPPNVVVLRSLTKFYAIPGLRLGCAVMARETAVRIRRLLPPWSVNTLAQAVGEHALRDTSDYAERTRAFVAAQRAALTQALREMGGLHVVSGVANFLLVRLDRAGLDARGLAKKLLRDRIAIRVCDNFDSLDARYFRIAVRTAEENERLCNALRRALSLPVRPSARRTPAIMLQGTSSGAGKSLMTAALCRILLDDGYRVAPFKSQNMSLNSFVTRDGGEMGRAQVVQAQACRLEPDVRMNPILLKPCSDTGAQIIVDGKPVGNMTVEEYIRYKPTAFAAARKAYDELAADHDVMVLEGAGSPAEVNLKSHDIVNMAMARHAGARVLVVGDIDRGGVFASFAGTLDALAEWERALVAGFVVNRFRGRAELLSDALRWTERATGCPVLGVVPYLTRLGIPEEDSVALKSGELARDGNTAGAHEANAADAREANAGDAHEANAAGGMVEIAIVELPHISNFTDFDALRVEPDVRVRYVRRPEELGRPDALVLPGSKNVIADLAFLCESGWDRAVLRLAREDRTELVGVCAGFQLLGQRIDDPHGLESRAGDAVSALGLLPIRTVLEKEKTLTRSKGTHLASGISVEGYEIHHGRTDLGAASVAIRREDGVALGARAEQGRVWGTYLHGVFDSDAFRRWFVDGLRRARGLEPVGAVCATYGVEPAIQRLADVVRRSVDLRRIYRVMGLT